MDALAQRAKVKQVLSPEHRGVWAYQRLPQTRMSFIHLGGKLHDTWRLEAHDSRDSPAALASQQEHWRGTAMGF